MCDQKKNNECCCPQLFFIANNNNNNNNNRIFAAGNIAITRINNIATVTSTTLDGGVTVANGGAGTAILTAPTGYRFITVQATTILSRNTFTQNTVTDIISPSFVTNNLGTTVILVFTSGQVDPPGPINGISVLAYLAKI